MSDYLSIPLWVLSAVVAFLALTESVAILITGKAAWLALILGWASGLNTAFGWVNWNLWRLARKAEQ